MKSNKYIAYDFCLCVCNPPTSRLKNKTSQLPPPTEKRGKGTGTRERKEKKKGEEALVGLAGLLRDKFLCVFYENFTANKQCDRISVDAWSKGRLILAKISQNAKKVVSWASQLP